MPGDLAEAEDGAGSEPLILGYWMTRTTSRATLSLYRWQ